MAKPPNKTIGLVKNTKHVKFPSACTRVKQTFRQAQKIAHQQEWTQVIIIGFGKNKRGILSSRMSEEQKIGAVEIGKQMLLDDM